MICKMCGREVKGAFAPGWVSVGKGGYGRVCPDCVEELGGTAMREKKEGESEDLRRCAICRKDVPFIHPGELVINVDGKVVCPVCEKKVAKLHETAEEHRKSTGHTKEEEEAEKRLQELRERNAKAAEAAIKFALGTHEALRGRCSCCGKSVPRNELRRYNRGKYYEIFPATLCPTCFREKNMERDLQVSDQALKNATRAFDDLKEEYESFRERTSRVWWGGSDSGRLDRFLIYINVSKS